MNHQTYLCCHVDTMPPLDGNLNKAPWTHAPWTDDFVDIEGDLKPKPHLRTRAKMLWDATYLYIGAEIEDPHVWGTITERDAVIFYDNDFEVFIDPDGDNHQYYELEMNALNTVWDLLLIKPYRDGGPAVNGWDIAGLKTAVHVDGTINDPTDVDKGWSVEIAIPWKALAECAHKKAPPENGDRWRINFSRVQWETSHNTGSYIKTPGRREDNWVWTPQGVIDMHQPETWGEVVFSSQPPTLDVPRPAIEPATVVRRFLMQIYHAQRKRRSEKLGYTSKVSDLALPEVPKTITNLRIETTSSRFVATAESILGGKNETWQVTEDSRISRSL